METKGEKEMEPKACEKCGRVLMDGQGVAFCPHCGGLLVAMELCLDPYIRDFVKSLWKWGIRTKMSCEGHLNHGAPYPWVDVPRGQAVRLAQLVARQNRPMLAREIENHNTWVIRPEGSWLRLIPEDRNRPLAKLQEDAVEFGKFLLELPDNWL